jgi:hypothetical protein
MEGFKGDLLASISLVSAGPGGPSASDSWGVGRAGACPGEKLVGGFKGDLLASISPGLALSPCALLGPLGGSFRSHLQPSWYHLLCHEVSVQFPIFLSNLPLAILPYTAPIVDPPTSPSLPLLPRKVSRKYKFRSTKPGKTPGLIMSHKAVYKGN